MTANDYTVDLTITPSMYFGFLKNERQTYYADHPIAYGFKMHLKRELEQKLTDEVPFMFFEQVEKVIVADIQFTYKNGEMIRILTDRGITIKNNDWKELKEVNERLDAIKTENYQDFIQPMSAFVTFESEEGV